MEDAGIVDLTSSVTVAPDDGTGSLTFSASRHRSSGQDCTASRWYCLLELAVQRDTVVLTSTLAG